MKASLPTAFSRIVYLLADLWFGLIVAISLIEAPLKFQAPGITIPLGLGSAGFVFGAMNVVEAVVAILLLVAAFRRGVPKLMTRLVTALGAVLLMKVAFIRPR